MPINRHGLSRYIPASVAREVRQRSKFGCVLCRNGFYEYEHIDPPFEDALEHDPARICCLCSSCHSTVTRRQRSKASVAAAYEDIQAKSIEEVGRPIGPLDFYGGNAELSIGGLRYSPFVKTVLRYHGQDIIKVSPGDHTTPGAISALFTDESGEPVLALVENAWEGSTANWDIEVVGPCITVRNKSGSIPLKLRLDPPGVIVIERLDMRIGDAHLLVSESAYAAGRYLEDDSIFWVHANISISHIAEEGVAIEFANPEELLARREAVTAGASLESLGAGIVLSAGVGCLCVPIGLSIASLCGGFHLMGYSCGIRPLDGVRRMINKGARPLMYYIGTGKETS